MPNLRKIIIILLLATGLIQAEEESAKVVYDLTTKDIATFEKKILSAIAVNKTHYEKSLRELDVTVVIHGGAYRFFATDPAKSVYKNDKALLKTYKDLAQRLKTMADTYEVEFLMCGVGMRKNKLKAKDVYSFVEVVPNSTIGLIDKQNEGYAYIPIKD